ncbi:MAG TPA: TonB family protein [Kofleriaceae bacterium]|nr:TonB family protein [Kofleriaceae bacterium]
MFAKLHLLSQDVPEKSEGLRWRAHPYLRMAGAVPKGPAVFDWNARQRADLDALWRDPDSEGARERLAEDLAAFCGKLDWTADAQVLEDADKRGGEYMLTLSAVPPELYVLPWEVIRVGETGTYLADHASAQVRYAVPGLPAREIQSAPPKPGVLFAWSSAGGEVPHQEQAAAIRAATEAGGVSFHELADVSEASLQAALDAGPPSVLHLLCHGVAGGDGEPSGLKWGTLDQPSEISAQRLARMLRHHDGALRLVVLSACGSGDGRGDSQLLGSLAQELHRNGIRNVVASRYPLSVPGSQVMTKTLYDKMLGEAWSLERALRHTRQTLLRVGGDGEAHPGDAYGIQLYAYDTERFVSDNEVEAERPVLASYPFGTAACPVPAKGPPRVELTLQVESRPVLDKALPQLRRLSEDDRLTAEIASDAGEDESKLKVVTTVDGAQRLLSGWRSKALSVAVGLLVLDLAKTANASPLPPIKPAVAHGVTELGKAASSTAKLASAKVAVALISVAAVVIAAVVVSAAVLRPQSSDPEAAAPQPSAPQPSAPQPSDPPSAPQPSDSPSAPQPSAPQPSDSPSAPQPSDSPSAPQPSAPKSLAPQSSASQASPPSPPAPRSAESPSSAPKSSAPKSSAPKSSAPPSSAPAAPKGEPLAISPHALEHQRVAGTTDVEPSNHARSTMIQAGVISVMGTVRLCVDAAGSVTESTLTKSTGYDDYDKELVAAVRGWRYQPYVANGLAFPVCSTATFVYSPR